MNHCLQGTLKVSMCSVLRPTNLANGTELREPLGLAAVWYCAQFRRLRRIRGGSAPLLPPTIYTYISLSPNRAMMQTTRLPTLDSKSLQQHQQAAEEDDGLFGSSPDLSTGPCLGLSPARHPISPVISLVYSSPHAQVRAALVAILG